MKNSPDLLNPPLNRTIDPAGQVERLQQQIRALTTEIDLLRRRDSLLKVHFQRLDEELRLAAKLQRDFMPRRLPEVGRVRFQTLFRPAGYVSGDLFDVMRLDETHLGVYIADAVGHGIPAALLTMFLKRALHTKEIDAGGYRLVPPGEAMGRLNQALVDQELSHSTFATALYALIDTATLRFTYARGGHPEPILLSKDGTLRNLLVEGSLLGVFPEEQFEQSSVQLQAGDRVVVYSDGVEVCFGQHQDDSESGFLQQLRLRRTLPAEQMLYELARHIDNQSGSLVPRDDLTLIVIDVPAE